MLPSASPCCVLLRHVVTVEGAEAFARHRQPLAPRQVPAVLPVADLDWAALTGSCGMPIMAGAWYVAHFTLRDQAAHALRASACPPYTHIY